MMSWLFTGMLVFSLAFWNLKRPDGAGIDRRRQRLFQCCYFGDSARQVLCVFGADLCVLQNPLT